MKPKHVLARLLLGALLGYFIVTSARAGSLRGAASRCDITPSQPVLLDGYGSRTNLSEGVHDPLSARVLAFEDNGHKLVLVSLDNLGFYNETAAPLRQAILDACHLEPSELLLCAIHTHSAPTLTLTLDKGPPSNVEYTRSLQKNLAEVVHLALDRLAPVQIGVGSGSSPVGVNRREGRRDDKGASRIVLGRNPAALTDREVQVLKVEGLGPTRLISVLFAYATHSTSLGPRNRLVSGDIHGLAAQFLENYWGSGVVTPEFAGASGDIDPWVRVLPGFKSTGGWIPETVLMATLLGEEAAQVAEGIRSASTNGPVKSLIKVISLPTKPGELDKPGADKSPDAFTITVGRVGDSAFVGLGGEVFNELGRRIKSGSPFAQTLIFTHCNGAAGYVPTRAAYGEGGYEVESSVFAPEAGERIVQATLQLLQELH